MTANEHQKMLDLIRVAEEKTAETIRLLPGKVAFDKAVILENIAWQEAKDYIEKLSVVAAESEAEKIGLL